MREFRTTGPGETEEVGKNLIRIFGIDRIFCLTGPLAAGKTTLVKGMAKRLGIKRTIVSPSYVLLREYEGNSRLFHLDLFRIESSEEFVEAGLAEFLLLEEGTVAIEWAERVEEILPEESVRIELELMGKNERRISARSLT